MSDIIIRKAVEKDVSAIETIEKQCFASPWSYESLMHDVAENKLAVYIVAEADEQICGYVGVWNIFDEGHITNVAVAPDFRRRHIAQTMLERLMELCGSCGVESLTLEVRASNYGAIKLYETMGFHPGGRRKGYYEDNGEDAIIMWCDLLKKPE